MTLAMEGKNKESLEGFNAFVEQYPESVLCSDAQVAIKRLQQDTVKPE